MTILPDPWSDCSTEHRGQPTGSSNGANLVREPPRLRPHRRVGSRPQPERRCPCDTLTGASSRLTQSGQPERRCPCEPLTGRSSRLTQSGPCPRGRTARRARAPRACGRAMPCLSTLGRRAYAAPRCPPAAGMRLLARSGATCVCSRARRAGVARGGAVTLESLTRACRGV